MPNIVSVAICWTSEELFSSVREIDLDEVRLWLADEDPAKVDPTREVTPEEVKEFIENGYEPFAEAYDLTAMSEGTSWHDRNDPTIDNVEMP